MENIYAAMLLHKAGKEINEESVTKVLKQQASQLTQSKLKHSLHHSVKLTLRKQSKQHQL